MSVEAKFVLFNNRKEFIGYSPTSIIPSVEVKSVVIPEEKRNLMYYEWIGDYDTGQMRPKKKFQKLITEYDLEKKFLKELEEKFSLQKQLFVIFQVVNEMRQNVLNGDFKDFDEIVDLMQKAHAAFERRKELVESDPEYSYLSKKEIQNKFK